jgi:hypothetical protein
MSDLFWFVPSLIGVVLVVAIIYGMFRHPIGKSL